MNQSLPAGYRFTNYRIIRPLGEGGFSLTYLIQDRHGNNCVLKELFPGGVVLRDQDGNVRVDPRLAENQGFWRDSVANFRDEAKVLSALDLNTIPRLLDTFQANRTLYMVLERIDGMTLEQLIGRFHGLAAATRADHARRFLVSLLETLNAIHQEGLLHRDIKPTNIMIRRDVTPVLIDFGGVRFQVGGVTLHYNKRPWTPGYSSPEQTSLQGIEQGAPSDLYALAATFYRVLFNVEPPDAREDRLQRKTDSARSFLELDSEYDHAFLESLDQAFELNPAYRFSSAEDWLRALGDAPANRSPRHVWLIGRDPDRADIVLDYADNTISGVHLEVREYDDHFELIDRSTNGTQVIESDGKRYPIEGAVSVDHLDYQVCLANRVEHLLTLIEGDEGE